MTENNEAMPVQEVSRWTRYDQDMERGYREAEEAALFDFAKDKKGESLPFLIEISILAPSLIIHLPMKTGSLKIQFDIVVFQDEIDKGLYQQKSIYYNH